MKEEPPTQFLFFVFLCQKSNYIQINLAFSSRFPYLCRRYLNFFSKI